MEEIRFAAANEFGPFRVFVTCLKLAAYKRSFLRGERTGGGMSAAVLCGRPRKVGRRSRRESRHSQDAGEEAGSGPFQIGERTGQECCSWPSGAHQGIPGARQGRLQTQNGGEQDVQLAGFNLLDSPGIDVYQFRELLLGESARNPLTAHVGAEFGEFRQFWAFSRHALLGRRFCLLYTAQWGVICTMKL